MHGSSEREALAKLIPEFKRRVGEFLDRGADPLDRAHAAD
jgi:hypothetical protein